MPHHPKESHDPHRRHETKSGHAGDHKGGTGNHWPRAEKVGAKPDAGRPRYLEYSMGDVDNLKGERPHYSSDTPDFKDGLFQHRKDAPGV